MKVLSSTGSEKFFIHPDIFDEVMEKLGYFVINDKIYKIDHLPENLVVDSDLNLSWSKFTRLPDNLTVTGLLFIKKSKIMKMPKNLKVGKYMIIDQDQYKTGNFSETSLKIVVR